jgi:hypothetical protein
MDNLFQKIVNALPKNLFGGLFKPKSTPTPVPTPKVMPVPTPDPVVQKIVSGLTAWGNGETPPIASMAAELKQVGESLPHKFLPAALALKESGGLRDSEKARKRNNPFNVKDQNGFVQYDNLPQAILGGIDLTGMTRRGLKGVLTDPRYAKYLQTGDLKDFFNVYSNPKVGNPSMEKQVADMEQLLSYFK